MYRMLSKNRVEWSLANAVVGEAFLLDFLSYEYKPRQISIVYDDVNIKPSDSPKITNNDVIDELTELMKNHKNTETGVWWCRRLAKAIPFTTKIKGLYKRSLKIAIEKGVIEEKTEKGVLFDSILYYSNENLFNEVVESLRQFALNKVEPQSIEEFALFALFYSIDSFIDAFSPFGGPHPFDMEYIFAKDTLKEARNNMKAFFKRYVPSPSMWDVLNK